MNSDLTAAAVFTALTAAIGALFFWVKILVSDRDKRSAELTDKLIDVIGNNSKNAALLTEAINSMKSELRDIREHFTVAISKESKA